MFFCWGANFCWVSRQKWVIPAELYGTLKPITASQSPADRTNTDIKQRHTAHVRSFMIVFFFCSFSGHLKGPKNQISVYRFFCGCIQGQMYQIGFDLFILRMACELWTVFWKKNINELYNTSLHGLRASSWSNSPTQQPEDGRTLLSGPETPGRLVSFDKTLTFTSL